MNLNLLLASASQVSKTETFPLICNCIRMHRESFQPYHQIPSRPSLENMTTMFKLISFPQTCHGQADSYLVNLGSRMRKWGSSRSQTWTWSRHQPPGHSGWLPGSRHPGNQLLVRHTGPERTMIPWYPKTQHGSTSKGFQWKDIITSNDSKNLSKAIVEGKSYVAQVGFDIFTRGSALAAVL